MKKINIIFGEFIFGLVVNHDYLLQAFKTLTNKTLSNKNINEGFFLKKLFSLFVVLANVLMINNLSPIELKASDIQQTFNIQDRSYYSLLFSNREEVHAGTNTSSTTYTSRSQTEIFTDIYSYVEDDGNDVEYPIYSYCSTG